MIRLYSSTETTFDNNGIGALSPTVCRVTEELNGEYELYMEIPITAEHYSEIGMRSLILAKANPYADPQPFRVYRMTKPLGGIVSVYARHLAYDLSGIVVEPFTASDIGSALNGFSTYAVTPSPFIFSTVRTTAANFSVDTPSAVWSLMGGQAGSILDVYGGEYDFDKFTVYILNRRGDDRGVSVRYGKNMIDLEQDTSCASCYTGVVAFWRPTTEDGDAAGETITGNLVEVDGTFDYVRIMPLDLTERWEEAPTVAQLDAAAAAYITANNIGVPDVSWKVEVTPPQTREVEEPITGEFIPEGSDNLITSTGDIFYYFDGSQTVKVLEHVYLGDTVSVYFERLGVNASARVVKTEYDALADRYLSVNLGRVKSNLADTIVAQGKEIAARPTRKITERIAAALSDSILNANGGSVRLLDTNGDGEADELYIADNPNPILAQKVWRFNYLGWAVSENGYNGTFTMGATISDGLLASFVTAANLRAGIIQSADGDSIYMNLDTGVLLVKNSDGDVILNVDAPNNKFIVNTPDLAIDGNGNATFSGTLNAADGTFGGTLSAANGTFNGSITVLDSSNHVIFKADVPNKKVIINTADFSIDEYGNATFSGDLNAAGGTFSGTIEGADLVLGGRNNTEGTLIVKNASGTTIATINNSGISASAGTFSGTLSAPTGTIGGFEIDSTGLASTGTNTVGLDTLNGRVLVGQMIISGNYAQRISDIYTPLTLNIRSTNAAFFISPDMFFDGDLHFNESNDFYFNSAAKANMLAALGLSTSSLVNSVINALPNIPTVATGSVSVSISSGYGTANVTFPSGRFSGAPSVTVSVIDSSNGSYIAKPYSITRTGFSVKLIDPAGSSNGKSVSWQAIEE